MSLISSPSSDVISPLPLPAIRFAPEAFQRSGPRIMGRQSAGEGFLRAIVELAGEHPLVGIGQHPAWAQAFRALISEADPGRKAAWIASDNLRDLAGVGAIHLPDPSLAEQAYLRTRVGSAAFSITGITHTVSSMNAMRMIAQIPMAPLMPWDALICTSQAVKAAVEQILTVQEQYVRWKFGASRAPQRPELPIIPLGVHPADFLISDAERQDARRQLGINPDEVVYMFLGRLSFHAKAHPFQMFAALEHAALHGGSKIVLLQCGWFANEHIERAFRNGTAKVCPSVRSLWLDGRKHDERRAAWGASDVFMSLSDNIQETFGLTLIEAMAAGRPVIASDWDGYRETVEDGVSGFLIPTFMPHPRIGEELSLLHAAGTLDYDRYIGLCSQMVSLDQRSLRSATLALARDGALRERMGRAGRARAMALFDWKVVIGRYRELWAELHSRRDAVLSQQGPQIRGVMADQLPPFQLFSGYPSHQLSADCTIQAASSRHSPQELLRDTLFTLGHDLIRDTELLPQILSLVRSEAQPVAPATIAQRLGLADSRLWTALAVMAKMELIEVVAPAGAGQPATPSEQA